MAVQTTTEPLVAVAEPDEASPAPLEEEEDPELAGASAEYRAKLDWVKQMRLQFCVRPDFEITHTIIHPDGMLNQDYFRPPRDAPRPGQEAPARKWTDHERGLLIQGITEYGIGHFRAISDNLLSDWSPNDLRIKTIRLIGRQNLQLYKNWQGGEAEILREHARNKAIAMQFDMWKNSCLVYDDDGRVLKAILASEPTELAVKELEVAAISDEDIEID